jgi:hypothetical protein
MLPGIRELPELNKMSTRLQKLPPSNAQKHEEFIFPFGSTGSRSSFLIESDSPKKADLQIHGGYGSETLGYWLLKIIYEPA